MAEIFAVGAADFADLFAHFHFAARFHHLSQMSVERLNPFSVRQSVFDYQDVSPTDAGIFGVNNRAVCRRENRLAAIGVAAGICIPIFA